jgi:phosphoribosylanthranilate isomerase
MIKIKICGITNLEDALFCSRQGADALGFIFTKKSPRCITVNEAAKVIADIDPLVATVGVFMDEEKDKVFEIASNLRLNVLQFHGRESPAYCNFFKQKFKVIKVFFPEDKPFKHTLAPYKVDAYLFDIKQQDKLRGVATLPPEALKEISSMTKEGYRIIISGGLNLKNISPTIRLKPYAVDIASGLEKLVGKKDNELVRAFIQKVKNVIPR